MDKFQCYENHPWWIVLIANLFSLAIYMSGAIILYRIGLLWMILYLLFVLFLESMLIKNHCVDCYYYGKTCAAGKGRICKLFFRRGNAKRFCQRKMTFKDLILNLLISFIPIIAGIVLLIITFDWTILILVIFLFLLTFAGNAFMHTHFICKYCRQRQLGCPADKMFDNMNKEKKNK